MGLSAKDLFDQYSEVLDLNIENKKTRDGLKKMFYGFSGLVLGEVLKEENTEAEIKIFLKEILLYVALGEEKGVDKNDDNNKGS